MADSSESPTVEPSARPKSLRVQSIQILRICAAVGVVIFHMGLLLPMVPPHVLDSLARVGVQLFFAISGFIIFVTSERQNARTFAIKRVGRLVPLYWLATGLAFAIGMAGVKFNTSEAASIPGLIKSLLFIPYLNKVGETHPLLYVGWTLNCEAYFYVLFAISMAIAHRYRHFLTCAIILAIYCLGLAHIGDHTPFQQYTSGINLFFVIGMMIALGSRTLLAKAEHPERLVPLAFLCLGLALAAFAEDVFFVVESSPLLAQLALVLLALSSMLFYEHVRPISKQNFFAKCGDATYSVYLLHPFVVGVATHILLSRLQGHTTLMVGAAAVILVVCVAIGMASYKYIELPFQKLIYRRFEQPA